MYMLLYENLVSSKKNSPEFPENSSVYSIFPCLLTNLEKSFKNVTTGIVLAARDLASCCFSTFLSGQRRYGSYPAANRNVPCTEVFFLSIYIQ